MKQFEVWSEGYRTNGMSGTAFCHGKVMAESFEEACEKMMQNSEYFNKKTLTFWGCRLYDNETDARKAFG